MSEHDEDRASSEGMPPVKERESQAHEAPADDETTFVLPEGLPFQCTALHLPQEDGATLVIDRDGAHVPSADLEALREQAALSGVLLNTEVSD
jgi:hypothetical protein